MTLDDQRERAVGAAYDLLMDLSTPGKLGRIPSDVRDRAARILRHYPTRYEISNLYAERDELARWKRWHIEMQRQYAEAPTKERREAIAREARGGGA